MAAAVERAKQVTMNELNAIIGVSGLCEKLLYMYMLLWHVLSCFLLYIPAYCSWTSRLTQVVSLLHFSPSPSHLGCPPHQPSLEPHLESTMATSTISRTHYPTRRSTVNLKGLEWPYPSRAYVYSVCLMLTTCFKCAVDAAWARTIHCMAIQEHSVQFTIILRMCACSLAGKFHAC